MKPTTMQLAWEATEFPIESPAGVVLAHAFACHDDESECPGDGCNAKADRSNLDLMELARDIRAQGGDENEFIMAIITAAEG